MTSSVVLADRGVARVDLELTREADRQLWISGAFSVNLKFLSLLRHMIRGSVREICSQYCLLLLPMTFSVVSTGPWTTRGRNWRDGNQQLVQLEVVQNDILIEM